MRKRFLLLMLTLLTIAQGAWTQTDQETPLTMEARTAGTIRIFKPKSGMQYSVNGGAKTAVTTQGNEYVISVSVGDKVQFYGNGTSITSYSGTRFNDGTAEYYLYGNIMSLVDENHFATATTLTGESAFNNLFSSSNLYNHPTKKLVLPATTLTKWCYANMFTNCKNLTTAPELPATTLAELCYTGMFANCTSLTTAPVLPAKTLSGACYGIMFSGCTSLNDVTCYATDVSAEFATYNWLKNVADVGTFVKAEGMTGWSTGTSGIPEGWMVKEPSTKDVATETELRNALTNSFCIKLTADIALSNYLGIVSGNTVTLDLNGHTLSRSLSAADDDGHVIWILEGGTLTVKDSSGDNSGKLTGGWAKNGGGINVSKNSTLYFQGGTITGCKGSVTGGAICNKGTCHFEGGVIDNCWSLDCGGIFNFDASCTLTISGGEIQNCSSNGGGGGVVNYGTATISGGTFTGNHCQTRGGGVWNSPGATMTITGGTFTGNRADLYGGGVFSYSSFNMSGNPVITDNTVNGNRNNLYLDNNAVINVTGAFTKGASIGITYIGTTGQVTSGFSTYNPDTDPYDIFFVDNGFSALYKNGSNEVYITIGSWRDYRSSGYSHKNGKTVYIENAAELALLADDVNNGHNIGYTFVLNKDLDMSAHYWTPIGTKSKPFRSSFEGNGHTISGILVNSAGDYNGLFGFVMGDYYEWPDEKAGCDYIRNLVLTNSYIKGQNITGGIAGRLDSRTTMENVVCQADVTGGHYVGGIVGSLAGDRVNSKGSYICTVRNCLYLSGKVRASGDYAAVIARVGPYAKQSNNYYADPASSVGNDKDVRAYPITASLPTGVTLSYKSKGVTYKGTRYHPAGKVEFTVNSGISRIVAVKVNGTELVNSDGVYSFTLNPSKAEAYEISVTTGGVEVTGSGTEADPYLITKKDDWDYIAKYLSTGLAPNDFRGASFKLTSDDITINQMMGTYEHPFKGTFDGDGHTLTVALGSPDSYNDRATGPFDCISDATIKNLTVTGSIYSSVKNNGGLAVRAKGGNNFIRNCVSRVSINNNRNDECTSGGFIGIIATNGTQVSFEGCVFAGELLGSNASNWGGFVGGRAWVNDKENHNTVSFTDCLFAPTYVDIATSETSNSRTFCRSTDNTTTGAGYTRCYYTHVVQLSDGGQQVYSTEAKPANIGEEVKDYGFATAYENGLKYGNLYYSTNPDDDKNIPNVTIDIAADYTALYEQYKNQLVNARLTGRTYQAKQNDDGTWQAYAYSVCPPFDMNLEDKEDVEVYKLQYIKDGNQFVFSLKAPMMFAGEPYLLVVRKGSVELKANKVQLVSESSEGTEVINWDNHEDPALGRWRGTLKKIEHDAAASQNAYILQKDGTFKHITEQSNAWMGAFVSAFYPHELPECDSFSIKLGEVFPGGGPDEDITMDFPADFFVTDCDIDDPTGIVEMRNEENSSPFTLHSSLSAWYTLDGRKLQGEPTQKGIYIHQGRKVVKK